MLQIQISRHFWETIFESHSEHKFRLLNRYINLHHHTIGFSSFYGNLTKPFSMMKITCEIDLKVHITLMLSQNFSKGIKGGIKAMIDASHLFRNISKQAHRAGCYEKCGLLNTFVSTQSRKRCCSIFLRNISIKKYRSPSVGLILLVIPSACSIIVYKSYVTLSKQRILYFAREFHFVHATFHPYYFEKLVCVLYRAL